MEIKFLCNSSYCTVESFQTLGEFLPNILTYSQRKEASNSIRLRFAFWNVFYLRDPLDQVVLD